MLASSQPPHFLRQEFFLGKGSVHTFAVQYCTCVMRLISTIDVASSKASQIRRQRCRDACRAARHYRSHLRYRPHVGIVTGDSGTLPRAGICMDTRIYGHKTTAMPDMSTPPFYSTLSSICQSGLQAILSKMQLTLHATRRTPHGASRLVQAMSASSVKTRHAPALSRCESVWPNDFDHA